MTYQEAVNNKPKVKGCATTTEQVFWSEVLDAQLWDRLLWYKWDRVVQYQEGDAVSVFDHEGE